MQRLAYSLGLSLAVLAVPSAAWANKHLRRAHKAYAKLEYEPVIKHLKRALKIAREPEEKLEIFEFLGRMYVMYSKEKAARAAFIEVLEIDPSFALPDTESPKILATLDQARAEVGGVVSSAEPAEPAAAVTTSAEDPAPPEEVAELTNQTTAPPAESDAATPPEPRLSTATSAPEFYETWWFWTAIGVVVAGAATGATMAVTAKPGPPEGDWDAIKLP